MSMGWDWAAPAPSWGFQILDFPLEKRLLFVPSLNEPLMLEMSNSSIPDLSHGKKTSRDALNPGGGRENSPTPEAGIGLDLGFLHNPKFLQNSALILSRRSQTGNFCHDLCARREAGKLGIRGFGKGSVSCIPFLKTPEVFSVGFPFPSDFSKRIPPFSPPCYSKPNPLEERGKISLFPLKILRTWEVPW